MKLTFLLLFTHHYMLLALSRTTKISSKVLSVQCFPTWLEYDVSKPGPQNIPNLYFLVNIYIKIGNFKDFSHVIFNLLDCFSENQIVNQKCLDIFYIHIHWWSVVQEVDFISSKMNVIFSTTSPPINMFYLIILNSLEENDIFILYFIYFNINYHSYT